MYVLLSSTAFLSGCIPIALINLMINYDNNDIVVFWFAIVFLILTSISGMYFWCRIKSFYKKDNEKAIVTNVKRKDIFASGAISYYVLPFVSFVSTGRGGVIILSVLIALFLQIFNNNRMFLYTPLFDVLGYKILECEIIINSKVVKSNIVTRDGNKLFFTGNNTMRVYKIDQDIYAAELHV